MARRTHKLHDDTDGGAHEDDERAQDDVLRGDVPHRRRGRRGGRGRRSTPLDPGEADRPGQEVLRDRAGLRKRQARHRAATLEAHELYKMEVQGPHAPRLQRSA